MKYVVVGTLPPPVLGRSAALLAAVRDLEREGHEVTVHPIGVGDPASRLGGLLAWAGLDTALTLERGSRGARLVLQVEPALVGEGAGRVRRALCLCLLAGVLRGFEQVTIRVDSFSDLPNGLGGRAAALLWRRADEVVVSSPELGEALTAAGAASGSVMVEPPDPGMLELAPWPADSDDPDVREVLSAVRGRAAVEQARSSRQPADAAAVLLASSGGPAPSPYGLLEPVIRFAYERPALREPLRRARHLVRSSIGR
jgi:hypothetical protein